MSTGLIRYAFTVGVVLCVTACNDSEALPITAAPFPDSTHAVAGVFVASGSVIVRPLTPVIAVGATLQLTGTAFDLLGVAQDATVYFFSGDASVASITSSGLVTARKTGTAIITGFTGLVSGTTTITVSAAGSDPTPTPTPTPIPISSAGWTFCTNAGAVCSFVGRRDVRLGASNGPFVTLSATGSIPCAAYGFNGQNPAPGQSLHCDYGPIKTETLYNPMPGMSGLNVMTVTVPLGAVGVAVTQSREGSMASGGGGSGSFRTKCSLAKFDFVDPIVYPGQPGASHLHVFFGNTGITANATAGSIASSGNSTCMGGTLNRSAYWTPALFDARTGAVITPDEGVVYYKTGYSINPAAVRPFPVGLRMIAGDKSATGAQAHADWGCRDRYIANPGTVPTTCPVGDAVRATIQFPQCWDGINLDSPDHKSHMAYPAYRNPPQVSTCPASHPVTLPEISEHVDFPVTSGASPANWRLTSDMYSTPARGGYSLHADWMNGWDAATMRTIVTNCLNKAMDCQVGLLGNGKTLY